MGQMGYFVTNVRPLMLLTCPGSSQKEVAGLVPPTRIGASTSMSRPISWVLRMTVAPADRRWPSFPPRAGAGTPSAVAARASDTVARYARFVGALRVRNHATGRVLRAMRSVVRLEAERTDDLLPDQEDAGWAAYRQWPHY